MWHNISTTDKYIRIFLGALFIYAALAWHPLFAAVAVTFFISAATSSCLVYKMLGINHDREVSYRYLSLLPKYNPEPVLIFCDQGLLLFRNDAALRLLYSLDRFELLTLAHTPAEIIKSNRELTTRYLQDTRTYALVIRGNAKESMLFVYGFDITQIVQGEEALKTMALSDALTQLPNRKQLILDLQQGPMQALALVDIKNFGHINGFYGHETGDKFLDAFAQILQTLESSHVRLYRVQSDIFALLHTPQEGFIASIGTLCSNRFVHIEEIEFTLEITIGFAQNGPTSSLLTRAETALIEAKKQGIKTLDYALLGDVGARYLENMEWSKRIKCILKGDGAATLQAYFQPILNTKTGAIEKYETLARVIDGDEVIAPIHFLNPAEQLGVLPEITMRMVHAALSVAQTSEAEFSINITVQDLQNPSFHQTLRKALDTAGVASSRIVLEILEDEEVYAFLELFKALKADGFKIALDDFGTGYSNFAKLQQIEVDYIKIDGSLIQSLGTHPKHLEVVRTINRYAHSIGALTIAEFVSDKALVQLLTEEKIDYLQGYAIGKPLPTLCA